MVSCPGRDQCPGDPLLMTYHAESVWAVPSPLAVAGGFRGAITQGAASVAATRPETENHLVKRRIRQRTSRVELLSAG